MSPGDLTRNVLNKARDRLASDESARLAAVYRMAAVYGSIHSLAFPLALWKMPLESWFFVFSLMYMVGAWATFIGYRTRIATAMLAISTAAICLYYGEGQADARFVDRETVAAMTLVLPLLDSGRSLSLDRYLAVRRAERKGTPIPSESIAAWPYWVLASMVAIHHGTYAWQIIDAGPDRFAALWAATSGSSTPWMTAEGTPIVGSVLWAAAAVATIGVVVTIPFRRFWKVTMLLGLAVLLPLWVGFGGPNVHYPRLAILVGCVSPAALHRAVDDMAGEPTQAIAIATGPIPDDPPRIGRWLSMLLGLAFGGFLFLGPYRAQVVKTMESPRWSWAVFHHVGADVCDLRYSRVVDGVAYPIIRHDLLGYESERDLPPHLRQVTKQRIYDDQLRVCNAARETWGPEDLDVRLWTRCTTSHHWKIRNKGRGDVCAKAAERARAARSGKAKKKTTTAKAKAKNRKRRKPKRKPQRKRPQPAKAKTTKPATTHPAKDVDGRERKQVPQ